MSSRGEITLQTTCSYSMESCKWLNSPYPLSAGTMQLLNSLLRLSSIINIIRLCNVYPVVISVELQKFMFPEIQSMFTKPYKTQVQCQTIPAWLSPLSLAFPTNRKFEVWIKYSVTQHQQKGLRWQVRLGSDCSHQAPQQAPLPLSLFTSSDRCEALKIGPSSPLLWILVFSISLYQSDGSLGKWDRAWTAG